MKSLIQQSFFLFLIFLFGGTFSLRAQYATNIKPKGFGSWGCFGTAMAETVIPGFGYILSREYDKAAIFGSLKWYSYPRYIDAAGDKNLIGSRLIQKSIKKKGSGDESKITSELTNYWNRADVDTEIYYRLGTGIAFLNIYDFYTYGCKKNTGTYYRLLDPINIFHVYDKWYFWAGLGVVFLSNETAARTRNVFYKLGEGVTEDEIRALSYRHYFTAIGEETLFRGVIQSGFYSWYQGLGLSKTASRYAGIASASVIFGAAHTGESGSASAGRAFVMGLIFGLIYQPNNETFDITTGTSLHFFNNFTVEHFQLNGADFHVSEGPVVKPSLSLPFSMHY